MNKIEHLVLHGVAIKKYAEPDSISEIIALPSETVEKVVESTTARGQIVSVGGKVTLSPAGKLILANGYSRFYADIRANEEFINAYERFEKINVELKALITAWQVRPIGGATITNDHSDKGYDDKIIDRLGELHERAEQVLAALSDVLPRMQVYRDKLMTALERAEDGAIEWVSDAKIESYHTLWFELHEDLLCMLGHERQE